MCGFSASFKGNLYEFHSELVFINSFILFFILMIYILRLGQEIFYLETIMIFQSLQGALFVFHARARMRIAQASLHT